MTPSQASHSLLSFQWLFYFFSRQKHLNIYQVLQKQKGKQVLLNRTDTYTAIYPSTELEYRDTKDFVLETSVF